MAGVGDLSSKLIDYFGLDFRTLWSCALELRPELIILHVNVHWYSNIMPGTFNSLSNINIFFQPSLPLVLLGTTSYGSLYTYLVLDSDTWN